MEMYGSRLAELNQERGEFIESDAVAAYHQYLLGVTIDYVQELTYYERKRIHNLKYYTWVEQQGKTYDEIQAQWHDPDYWADIPRHVEEIDALIEEFNAKTFVEGFIQLQVLLRPAAPPLQAGIIFPGAGAETPGPFAKPCPGACHLRKAATVVLKCQVRADQIWSAAICFIQRLEP
jgi:hypothetical protein